MATTTLTPSLKLFQGLSDQDRKDLESVYKSSKRILIRIIELAEKELQTNLKQSESQSSFECANWTEKQSFNFGYRQGIRNILKTIRKADHDL